MNPSAEDFIAAFDTVNADTIFVLPNNGNIILAARQAAEIYQKSDVRVLESKTVGDGYAALTMLDLDSGGADVIEENLRFAMEGVITAHLCRSVRDTHLGGLEIAKNDFIGFVGKQMLADAPTLGKAAQMLLSRLDMTDREAMICLCGKESDAADVAAVRDYMQANHPMVELFEIDGGQDVYPLILVLP